METIQEDINNSLARIDKLMIQLQKLKDQENNNTENNENSINISLEPEEKKTIMEKTKTSTNYFEYLNGLVILITISLLMYMASFIVSNY